MICLNPFILILLVSIPLIIVLIAVLYYNKQYIPTEYNPDYYLNKISNILNSQVIPKEVLPERTYTNEYTYNDIGKLIGYLYNGGSQYPLYENRRGRDYYYYILNNTQNNNVRIPFNKQKNDQIYDTDTINLPEIGVPLSVKLYDYQGNKYNPYVY